MSLLLATAALLIATAGDPPAPPDDDIRQAYQAARAAAGRTPDDQVRLAYWCEAHGLSAERVRHLAQAVLADPNHAAARGLLGLVARGDRWLRPEAVANQVKADPTLAAKLAEYDLKRSQTPYTADGQWQLAQWADEQGLPAQARAHYTAVIRLDPKRELAWKKLGYAKRDGRWATDAEVTAVKADTKAQEAADRKWKPLLEKWKAQLGRPNQRVEAEANLLTVTDPRAVPSIGKVFDASEADGPRAVQLLGQIDAPGASRALAFLAAFGSSTRIRREATETLRGRDPREYANLLIPFLHKPIQYEIRPVNGPGQPGVLFVQGEKANIKRLYEPTALLQPGDQITIDRFGQPVVDRTLASFSAAGQVNARGERIGSRGVLGTQSTYQDFYSESSMSVGLINVQSLKNNPTMMADLNKMMHTSGGQPAAFGDMVKHGKAASEHSKAALVQVPPGANGFLNVSNGSFTIGAELATETSAEFSLAQVMAETHRSAQMSQQQLDRDVAQVEAQNRSINDVNDRVRGILTYATGEDLPADPTAWQKWWVNLLGYALATGQTAQNPTFVEVIPSGYQPEVMPTNIINRTLVANLADCFGPGTVVQTLTGPQPIEALHVGDIILSQNVITGALGYQPITVTHHNPPAPTFRVHLGNDTLVVSHFHRFWVARRGWVMARDLKAGDPVRTLDGVVPVGAVEEGKVELVYNLDVAEDADFFAGTSAALVHDNNLPDPRLVPFDLAPVNEAKAVAVR